MIALEGDERGGDGVDAGNVEGFCERRLSAGSAISRGNVGDERADDGSGRVAAALAGSGVVHKKEAVFSAAADGAAEISAENVLLDDGTGFARA